MCPRCAIRAGQAAIGFLVANDFAGLGVPAQASTEFHGQVCQDATGAGDVAFLDIGDGPLAVPAALHKVQELPLSP